MSMPFLTKNVLIFLLLVSLLNPANVYSFGIKEFYFFEKDSEVTEILYKTTCIEKDSNWFCNLNAAQMGNEKSKMYNCTVVFQELMDWTLAIYGNQTWTISGSKGVCGYTNTYVISSNGLVQTKTSPSNASSELCQSFPPKIYKMIPVSNDHPLKTGNCKELKFIFP